MDGGANVMSGEELLALVLIAAAAVVLGAFAYAARRDRSDGPPGVR